jgi:hypothetical protein
VLSRHLAAIVALDRHQIDRGAKVAKGTDLFCQSKTAKFDAESSEINLSRSGFLTANKTDAEHFQMALSCWLSTLGVAYFLITS